MVSLCPHHIYNEELKYVFAYLITTPHMIEITKFMKMKLAIIGAGAGGLASVRRAKEYQIDCVVYESSENIGGCWVCYLKPSMEHIENQIPIGMYPSLRTNLPTQLMEFPGFKFEPKSGLSYPSQREVLEYLLDFAKTYDLNSHIKLNHRVINISRKSKKWTLTVKNRITKEIIVEEFDGVMVCSGHNTIPNYAKIKGLETFTGHQIHSCFYRTNDSYIGKTVLIIGCGASGLDHSREIAKVAKKVIISHRVKTLVISVPNIIQKPAVKLIDENLVLFIDDTTETIDALVHCTGYKYEFSFIDDSCQLEITNGIIYPLYKALINANNPSMCLIGLLQKTIIFQLLDLQAQVFLKALLDKTKLPSKTYMLAESKRHKEKKFNENIKESAHFYYLGAEMEQYFCDLYKLGGKPLSPVIFGIYKKNQEIFAANYDGLRDYRFVIIDDSNFTYCMIS